MNLRSSLTYGLRSFLGRKKAGDRTRHHLFIPVLSIALSLVPVIVILVVANGMIEGITLRYLEFDTGHLRLSLSDPDDIRLVEDGLPRLKAMREIVYASLEVQGGGLLVARGNRSFVNIRGVDKDLLRRDPGFARFIRVKQGAFDLTAPRSIVIGEALADEYGLKIGDSLLVLTHRTSEEGGEKTFVPRPNRFIVTGVYSIGYQLLDKQTVFISFTDARRALSYNNSYTHLKLKVVDPFSNIGEKASAWEQVIAPQAMFWRLQTWQEINGNYFSAYQSIKTILVFLMLLIVLVAAFNIVSSMIMVVLDRFQEIGILKSLGAGAGSVTFSFLCVGFLSGLLSTVLGLGTGLVIAVNINEIFIGLDRVLTGAGSFFNLLLDPFTGPRTSDPVRILNPEYYLETIPIRIDFWEIMGIGLFALLLSVLFAFFPARLAGKIRPLEVIRKH